MITALEFAAGWPGVSGGIGFLGSATTVDSSGLTTRDLSKPALADGCVVVLVCSGNAAGPALTTLPTGFSLVRRVLDGTNTYFDVATKVIASASAEASVTWTVAHDIASKGAYHALAYSGVDTTTPFDAENGAGEAGAGTSPATHTTPSITTTADGRVLISAFADRQTAAGVYTGHTDTARQSDNTGATNAITHLTQDSVRPVVAGSYSRSIVVTGTGTYSAAVMWIGALKPAAGGPLTDTRTDPAGLVDVVSPSLAYARTQDDAAGLVDALVTALARARTLDDTTGLTDAVSGVLGGALTDTRTDAAGLVDVVSPALAAARAQTDPAGLVDALVAAVAAARTVDDPAGLTDAVVTQLGKLLQLDDPAGLADVAAAVLAYARTQTDPAGLVDVVSPAAGWARPNTDGAGLGDALVAALTASRTQTDVVGLGDSLVATLTRTRSVSDTGGLADSLVVELLGGGPAGTYARVELGTRTLGGPALGERGVQVSSSERTLGGPAVGARGDRVRVGARPAHVRRGTRG